ncbi:translation initiation factor eif-2b subunit epsilon [Anaeramoeba flamelloides]|uniref:Translation initiation factor eif-2b subunit epsilon n=1 Tax=Anaeramoeba flamelloides TaxID=1746091 RepID=A0AAV7ZDU7_9EUKA|nr:translation initiation factor eif-2b subunit epsilon [Anaeramoeba flamelloides]
MDQDDYLQAIVVGCDFTDDLRQITPQPFQTKILNIPILMYTIEFLAFNGVQEIIVHTGTSNGKTPVFLQKCRKIFGSKVKIIPFEGVDCTCTVDVLRRAQEELLLKKDFLLVPGCLISNIDIKDLVVRFKKRKKKDPRNILEIIAKRSPTTNISPYQNSESARPLIGVNKKTRELVYFEEDYQNSTAKLGPPLSVFKDHPSLKIYSNLTDVNIYICSIDIFSIFEIDSRTMNDVINVALGNAEIQTAKITVTVFEKGYAATVNLPLFNAYKRLDGLANEMAFPIVPEMNSLSDTTLRYYRSFSYREGNVVPGKKN